MTEPAAPRKITVDTKLSSQALRIHGDEVTCLACGSCGTKRKRSLLWPPRFRWFWGWWAVRVWYAQVGAPNLLGEHRRQTIIALGPLRIVLGADRYRIVSLDMDRMEAEQAAERKALSVYGEEIQGLMMEGRGGPPDDRA